MNTMNTIRIALVVVVLLILSACAENPTTFGNPLQAAEVMAATIYDQAVVTPVAAASGAVTSHVGVVTDNVYFIGGAMYSKANWRCAAELRADGLYEVYCLSKIEGGGDRSFSGVTFTQR